MRQLPPLQASVQVEPFSHFISQLPPEQLSLQVPLAAHENLQLPFAQPAPTATDPAPALPVLVPAVVVPPVASPPVVAVSPPAPVLAPVVVPVLSTGVGVAGSVDPVDGELGEPSCCFTTQPTSASIERAKPNAVTCLSLMDLPPGHTAFSGFGRTGRGPIHSAARDSSGGCEFPLCL
jgi:hypothetical protein